MIQDVIHTIWHASCPQMLTWQRNYDSHQKTDKWKSKWSFDNLSYGQLAAKFKSLRGVQMKDFTEKYLAFWLGQWLRYRHRTTILCKQIGHSNVTYTFIQFHYLNIACWPLMIYLFYQEVRAICSVLIHSSLIFHLSFRRSYPIAVLWSNRWRIY